MYDYLLRMMSCLCLLPAGLQAAECIQEVLARRETFYVPQGDSLSLSCVVQHCGGSWRGTWMWKSAIDGTVNTIKDSHRHHLTTVELSANKTQLFLTILKAGQLDEGSYGCRVDWSQGYSDEGHWTYVNVTTAVSSPRKLLHRVLVCAAASLCLPVILGLARCLSSRVKPQPFPRIQTSHLAVHTVQPDPAPQPPPRCPVRQKQVTTQYKAPTKSQQKTEVVYADISKAALRQQPVIREPPQSTVYSSVTFS